MAKKNVCRVILQDRGTQYCIFRVGASKDGSLMVTMPYHQASEGSFAVMPVSYGRNVSTVRRSAIRLAHATKQAKLSYHTSGYAQFSGEGIRSNVVALHSVPLFGHGFTGPGMSVQFWGLPDFQLHTTEKNTVCFDTAQAVGSWPRKPGRGRVLGYAFEIHILPAIAVLNIRTDGEEQVIDWVWGRHQFTAKVVPLKGVPYILALRLIKETAPSGHASGWIFNGPGRTINPRTGAGEVIQGAYPAFPGPYDVSMDYVPPSGNGDAGSSSSSPAL